MESLDQNVFNILVTIIATFGGWILKTIWDSVKELKESDKELTERVHELDKLVAGDYVKQDYLHSIVSALFQKLDVIHDKLDKKVDK